MQAECRTSSLLVRYAKVPVILCKVTEKIIRLQILEKKYLAFFSLWQRCRKRRISTLLKIITVEMRAHLEIIDQRIQCFFATRT